MKQQQALRLVDTTTGQAHDSARDGLSFDELHRILTRQERELNGYRLKVFRLEEELAEVREVEPGAPQIREVLENCNAVLGLKCKISAASEGWKKVKARFRDFDIVELKAVPHGAARDGWYRARRHRLRPNYLYRTVESVQELAELGLDVAPKVLPNGLSLTRRQEERLAAIAPAHFFALDACDCGHLRMEHATGQPPHGFQSCLHTGCACIDFDDIDRRADAWLAEQRRKAA